MSKAEESLAKSESEMERVREMHKKELEDAKESHESMISVFDSEKKLALRDLNMQLEIANAQRSEFEEACNLMKQEVNNR